MNVEDCFKDWGIVTLFLAMGHVKIRNLHSLWYSRIVAWEHVESCLSDDHSKFRDEFTTEQKVDFLKHLTVRMMRLCGAHASLEHRLYPLTTPMQGDEMHCLQMIETNGEFFNLWKTVHGEKDFQDLMYWVKKIR